VNIKAWRRDHLWITVGLEAQPEAVRKSKKPLCYGWKLLLSSLLDTVLNNLYTLIIGTFSADMLGY
jgi:hypothetical protein